MKEVFILVSVLFGTGAIGTVLNNRRLGSIGRRDNWIKYFFYFFVVLVVLGSALFDRRLFAALIILVVCVGLTEMMDLGNKMGNSDSKQKVLILALFVLNILFALFTIYILQPVSFIVYTYTIVMTFDGGSQIFGRLFGKHRITPVISPNKTWEGFIYGTLISVLAAIAIRDLVGFSLTGSVAFGLVVSVSSFYGDILASTFKRAFGVKNYSNLLPGQGGMFDRFDSFMLAGAVAGLFGMAFMTDNVYDKDILLYMVLTNMFLFILILGEFLYFSLKVKAEFARMIAHIFAGMASLLLLNKFSSEYYVLALCIQSAIFLYVTSKLGFLKSHHNVVRKTDGSPLFFAGILIAYYTSVLTLDKWLFVLPLMILTFCDPIAAFVGMNIKSVNWANLISGTKSPKTYLGSLAFFIPTFLLLFFGMPYIHHYSWPALFFSSLVIAAIVTLVETISSGGFDNLTIPISVILLILGVIHFL